MSALVKRSGTKPLTWCGMLFGVVSLMLAPTANAENDGFTQVGTWTCVIPADDTPTPPCPHTKFPKPCPSPPLAPAARFTCPFVTFPTQFGGRPNVVISACVTGPALNQGECMGIGSDLIALQDVTPLGFTPMPTVARLHHRARSVSGNWIAVGPRVFRGTAKPRYLVLTVIYAPPGTNAGHSTSSVAYSSGSTTGTLLSASQSFQGASSLSLDGKGGVLGNGGGIGVSVEYVHSTTDNQSLEVRRSVTSTINRTGPSQDGLNHDEDQIYLLLQPTIDLALAPSSAAWMLADAQGPIQYVYVGWLNGHMQMPRSIMAALRNAGVTEQDYPAILARDPLADGSTTPDPRRFAPLKMTYPYEPPYSATDAVPTITTNLSDSSTSTVGSTAEDTYKVALSVSGEVGFFDVAKTTLRDTASWQWTNRASRSTTSGTTQSASLTIGGPSFAYPPDAPTVMKVYLDTIYRTFAFALVPANLEEVGVKGTIVNAGGRPLAATEVTLVENQTTQRTFTNAKGEYVFFGHIDGPAIVQAAGVARMIAQSQPSRTLVLRSLK